MGERRILVIGSQCAELNALSFLPKVAQDLYEVMIDPKLGGCVSALEGSGLLHDPTVKEAREAIETAFERASDDEATLFLVFIGHGEYVGDDFYLLPKNASVPPLSHSAINLVQLIKELYRVHSSLDGLVTLLDTCYSGVAAFEASSEWVRPLSGRLRFEMLSAVADRPAADGCFSRSLTHAIRKGLAEVASEDLRCEKVRPVIEKLCPKQKPQHGTWFPDDGLYLAKNVARFLRKEPWVGTSAAVEIERLLSWYQPTPQLSELVGAARAKRYVALIGEAGVGKSAFAAALARSELTEGIVPEDFVQAVAFISEGTTPSSLAAELSKQLQTARPDFAWARDQFRSQVRSEDFVQLDALQREILCPLRFLGKGRELLIVVDGLDRISSGAALPVYSALEELATDPALSVVRLVVTSRPDTELPGVPQRLQVGRTDDKWIAPYLERRGISPALQPRIVAKAHGNWLIARLLADLALILPNVSEEILPSELKEIYDSVLRQAGANDPERWQSELRPVFSVLAAAGVGPILPLPLLCAASARLGGPSRPPGVRDILVGIRGFVVRARPGTDEEHVGVFHQTFAEYLMNNTGEFQTEAGKAHNALLEAIAELAPIEQHDMRSPLHRFAAAAEAEHLWAMGKYSEAIATLRKRQSPVPAENLGRWKSWFRRVKETLGPDHPEALTTRNSIAHWTGQSGDAAEALRLFKELLPHQERVLGPHHSNTLRTRINIAGWIGQSGDAAEALRLSRELLPDQERVLGPDHPETLTTRGNIAHWTGQSGDAAEALRLFKELLLDRQRVLGPDHPDTLATRNSIAHWTGESGDAAEALRLFKELLPDRQRVLGFDHPDPLATRNSIARWTGESGDAAEALRLFKELLPDRQQVLGFDHPDTLATRNSIGHWTGESGD